MLKNSNAPTTAAFTPSVNAYIAADTYMNDL